MAVRADRKEAAGFQTTAYGLLMGTPTRLEARAIRQRRRAAAFRRRTGRAATPLPTSKVCRCGQAAEPRTGVAGGGL